MKLLITGGAGFIGSAFVRMIVSQTDWRIVNLDKLTYAGNLENLLPVSSSDRYRFVHGDIGDAAMVDSLFNEERPDAVVHFAAESHVDRSILSPEPVVQTNFFGTFTLLEAARRNKITRFVHVSTDEVYGSIPAPGEANEDSPLNASSPYSASKAGSDLLARSYFVTYRLPVLITRASNNYGPYQFPEKLMRETGWRPVIDFEEGLARTIQWYRDNSAWVERVRSGEYLTYYERNYGGRAVVP
jgi:dTDP-glucose 4,6-dehydratase